MDCPLEGVIAGIDEAGRGPLAGPVVSACVVWQGIPFKNESIRDSKLLSSAKRAKLYTWVTKHAYKIGIGLATNEEIEEINILQASLLSMERALMDTVTIPDLLLIDGPYGLKSFPDSRPIVKGDRKCFLVAAASIVAKVVRDRIMDTYHLLYPQYNFLKNKGYPTKEHKEAIKRFGLSPIHRKTFKV